jgi:hypothetical protein
LSAEQRNSRTRQDAGHRNIYSYIGELTLWHAAILVAVFLPLGQVLNKHYPLDNFVAYESLFLPAILIAFAEIRLFVRSMGKYKMMVASHPIRETGAYISKLLHSYWALPGLVVISSLYIYSTISLRYVALNPMGYFALIVIALVMISAVLAQTCYIYYLLLLRRVTKCELFKYNFYFPARTDWVQFLANVGTHLSNGFFLLGFIYTTVFYLNMPSSYLAITLRPWHVRVTTPNNVAFIASWLTIFIIIPVAFLVYGWMKGRFLKAIIRALKDTSIAEIEALITESNIRKSGNVDAELKYYQLMANIENSSSNASGSGNLLPVLVSLTSIAVQLIKISESLSP